MIKGKGSYSIGALAARVAQMIPKGTFEHLGASMGGAAGRGLANITGVGDYVFNDIVHTPALPTRNQSNEWRISNCEYITDLNASGGALFALRQFMLNPGDPGSFPWLSRVARLYQKYRFEQLIFEFRSNTSDYAAAGPLGTVIMAPTYNVLADLPQSKQQLEAYSHAVSTKPSNSIMCGVECDPREANIKWYYVRSPYTAPTQFTDPGVMITATSGLPATSGSALGELWVHYTVRFDEPILTTVQAQQAYARIRVTNNASGLASFWFAGVSAVGTTTSGIDVADPNISSDVAAFRENKITTGKPSFSYFTAIDNSSIANTARWWFSSPGTYLVQYVTNLSTGYTGITTGQGLYTADLASGTTGSSVALLEDNRPQTAGDGTTWGGTFTIIATGPDTAVDFKINPLNTGLAGGGSVVISQSILRITRI